MPGRRTIDALELALATAIGVERARLLTELANALSRVDAGRGRAVAGEALELLAAADGATDADRARAVIARCKCEVSAHDLVAAARSAEEALAFAEADGDSTVLAGAHSQAGWLQFLRGDRVEGEKHCQVGLEAIADHPEAHLERALLNTSLGCLRIVERDLDSAHLHFLRALAESRASGDRQQEANSLMNLGNLHSEQGSYAASLETYRVALAIQREIHDRAGVARSLHNLAVVHHRLGAREEARGYCQESLAIGAEIGLEDLGARLLMASLRAESGEVAEAIVMAETVLSEQRASQNPFGESFALANLGDFERYRQNWDEAEAHYRSALQKLVEAPGFDTRATCIIGLAHVYLAQGRAGEALAELDVLRRIDSSLVRTVRIQLHELLAEVLTEVGDHDGAIRSLHDLLELERETLTPDSIRRIETIRVLHEVDHAHARERVLEEARDELERRVAERTAELEREHRERARLEEHLLQRQKMEAIGRLAGAVTHELNNLLTVIQFAADQIGEGAPAEGASQAAVAEIRAASRRAGELTSQVLAFARKRPLNREAIDVDARIGEIRTMLNHAVGPAIRLVIDSSPDVGMALVDPGQFEQALLNLVNNGRDAMPDGGVLTIESRSIHITGAGELPPGPYVAIRVKDTGCGVLPEVREHLFEPFYTTKAEGDGAGLGLAVVYGMARQSGGLARLVASAPPDGGSTFEIVLPRVEAERAATRAATSRVEPAAGGGHLVVVLDAASTLRELFARELGRAGYEVVTAGSGEEALARVAGESRVDLVVTDAVTPGMTADELFRGMRARHPDVAFLFTSGDPDRTPELADESGYEFMEKPFAADALRARVDAILRRDD